MAIVRYFVSDIEEAIAFYTQRLGFSLEENFGPFAIVSKEIIKECPCCYPSRIFMI